MKLKKLKGEFVTDEYKNKKVQKVKKMLKIKINQFENIKSNTENKGYFNKNGNLSLNFNEDRNNINNNDNDNGINVNASDINSTKSTKSTNSNDFVHFQGEKEWIVKLTKIISK